METNAPFTKAEMLEQLQNALMMFVRSTSCVLDRDAALRLLGWTLNPRGDALRDPGILDASEVERLDNQTFDFSNFQVHRTFEHLYDYGVLGFTRNEMDLTEGATQETMAIAFVFDFQNSELISEMHNGLSCSVTRCIHAANLAIARSILDGEDRLPVGPVGLPSDLLTIPEVALLANMEERSVRNLASGKRRPDSLKTVTREGARYVSRDDAREWLKDRRGFTPTKLHGPLAERDLALMGFEDSAQVTDYIFQRAAALGVMAELFEQDESSDDGMNENTDSVEDLASDEAKATALAKLLNVNPELLQLRIQEAIASEQLARLRKAIKQTKGRLP